MSSEDEDVLMPFELEEAMDEVKNDVLPEKSKEYYDIMYQKFLKWKSEHGEKSSSEKVLIEYFTDLTEKYKPSTLWSVFSMLKSSMKLKEKVNIENYTALKAYLRKQAEGFTSKKTPIFSTENVKTFLEKASDKEHLITKVFLIFAYSGACRSNELVAIENRDIKEQGDLLVVELPKTKTKRPRTFVINAEHCGIVKKYMNIRPKDIETDRFFIRYANGKCNKQVIGIHKLASLPSKIAAFLKLDDPNSYTGYSFRRNTATFLAETGEKMATRGSSKSNTAADDTVDGSKKSKQQICDLISESINFALSEIEQSAESSTSKEVGNSVTKLKAISGIDKTGRNIFHNCTFIINSRPT